jgi:hypothetical protein
MGASPQHAEHSQEIAFELACAQDDAAIRGLLARNAVPGQVTLAYTREPDYFLGCPVMGALCQTLVARDQTSGQVAGVATRSVRPLFVNGAVENVGYIGQLRVDERFRGRWIVAGGFRLFHQLHDDGRAQGYITTIVEGNREAEGILVSRARRHYPAYRAVERLCTLAIILLRPQRLPKLTLEIRSGEEVDLDDVIRFWHTHGATRQFAPVYTAVDFPGPATRDFRLADLVVACRGGEIVGTAGLWDQSAYKQTVVKAYSPQLRRLRPLYNTAARIFGAQPLTAQSAALHAAYASFICCAGADPTIFAALLARIYNLAAERHYAFLTLGLSTRDPLLPVARAYLHIPYYSQLYTVCWQGDEQFHSKLDGRVVYVEIATL